MTFIVWRPFCLLSPILLLSSYLLLTYIVLFYSQCSSGTCCRHRTWGKWTKFHYTLKATLCAPCFVYYSTLIITETRFGIQWCHLQGIQLIIVHSSQHVQMVISSDVRVINKTFQSINQSIWHRVFQMTIWTCCEETTVKSELPEVSFTGCRNATEWYCVHIKLVLM